jgi:DNA-binding NtrC family response regulator
MNGLALMRALRELRPDLPVAIASGYEGPDVDGADRAGLVRIPKPVSMDALSQALRRLLS